MRTESEAKFMEDLAAAENAVTDEGDNIELKIGDRTVEMTDDQKQVLEEALEARGETLSALNTVEDPKLVVERIHDWLKQEAPDEGQALDLLMEAIRGE
jgi:hypothetical protein